ncbi:MAG: cupredoxin domain-containing protein [Acidimicrobiia bacterium]
MDRTRAALVAIGLLSAMVAVAGTAAADTRATEVEDYRFAPGQVRIEPGDRVRWTNTGDQVHTVTSNDSRVEDFDSGRLGEDDEFTHTFRDEGTFGYHCEIHASMKGVVQVGEPPPTTTTTRPPTTTTPPAPATTTTTAPAPAPAPETTTTTVGAPPTTTTTSPAQRATTTTTLGRPPASAAAPVPTPNSAPENTTTTAPATTTSLPAETTSSTAGGAVASDTPLGPDVPNLEPPPPPDGEGDLAGDSAAPLPTRDSDGTDARVLLLLAAVLGAGAFGGWTLWKLRPGKA